MNKWICDKCENEFRRNQLSDLSGWGYQFCYDCVRAFMKIDIDAPKNEDKILLNKSSTK